MVIATRIINLLSGLITLATGMYVEIGMTEVFSETVRLLIITLAVAYFASQFCLQVLRWLPSSETVPQVPDANQIIA